MARKNQELRPLMTRIPEKLRAQLEKAAKRANRSMNAELIHRLEITFNATDFADRLRTEVRDFETTVSTERTALERLRGAIESAKTEMHAAKADALEMLSQAKVALDLLSADDRVDQLPAQVQEELEAAADALLRRASAPTKQEDKP